MRIVGTDDDAYLEDVLIPGVTAKVEALFGVSLREQTFTQTQDRPMDGVRLPDIWHPPRLVPSFSGTRIKLMRRPVTAVTSVVVTDEDGDSTTVSTSDYYVSGEYVVLKRALPTYRRIGGVVTTFTAGYETIPYSVKAELMRLIDDVYAHRGTYVTGTTVARLPDVSGMFIELREVTV